MNARCDFENVSDHRFTTFFNRNFWCLQLMLRSYKTQCMNNSKSNLNHLSRTGYH